jgi:hypothetical protein
VKDVAQTAALKAMIRNSQNESLAFLSTRGKKSV